MAYVISDCVGSDDDDDGEMRKESSLYLERASTFRKTKLTFQNKVE